MAQEWSQVPACPQEGIKRSCGSSVGECEKGERTCVMGEHGLRWQATAPLGDRVVIDGIEIDRGDVVLSLREHGADDPMCCPSVRTETRFTIRGARLVARTKD